MNTRPWLITAPSIGLILLFVAWSGYWFFLIDTAKNEFKSARAHLEKSGLTLTCAEESFGGYPFRISFDCVNPQIETRKDLTEARYNANHLRVLAQAYKLKHIIIEIDGELIFEHTQHSKVTTIPATTTKGKINSKSLRASVKLQSLKNMASTLKNLKALSIISHGTKAEIQHKTSWGQLIPLTLKADKSGFHIRAPREPGISGQDTDLAIEAVKLKLKGDFYTPLEGDQFTAERVVLNGLVRSFYPAFKGNSSLPKNWHTLGGVAEVDAFLVVRNDFTLRGEGILSIDQGGQLSGSMDAKFLGMENIFAKLVEKKVLTNNQAALANTGLQILSKSTTEEQKQKILTIPVNFTNGQVYFGPHSLGFSPSFF